MRLAAVLLCCVAAVAPAWAKVKPGFFGIPGDYCKVRRNAAGDLEQCCQPPNPHRRDDECTMPILGNHKCYCDMFCDRSEMDPTDPGDCCPDFEYVCRGKPKPMETGPCMDDDDVQRRIGETVKVNCQTCTCTSDGWANCQPNDKCLIDKKLLEANSKGRYTWDASPYKGSWPWGKTLADGVVYRLGTLYPDDAVQAMHGILPPDLEGRQLPDDFDARQEWPGKITGAADQGDCGASWAFSTVSLAADRLAILSKGKLSAHLSAQQLLSCNQHRQRGCDGGYLDRAWWYIRRLGVVSDACYPYTSGVSREKEECKIPRSQYANPETIRCPESGQNNKIYRITPPYRMASSEEDIKKEIFINGPVQATFRVYRDFYMYKSGVYQTMSEVTSDPRSNSTDMSGYHSVKIIGWGVDRTTNPNNPVPYWLCVNSWGESWGDQGMFKILRGKNHCEIESFVITALGQGSKKRRRLRKMMRRRLRKF